MFKEFEKGILVVIFLLELNLNATTIKNIEKNHLDFNNVSSFTYIQLAKALHSKLEKKKDGFLLKGRYTDLDYNEHKIFIKYSNNTNEKSIKYKVYGINKKKKDYIIYDKKDYYRRCIVFKKGKKKRLKEKKCHKFISKQLEIILQPNIIEMKNIKLPYKEFKYISFGTVVQKLSKVKWISKIKSNIDVITDSTEINGIYTTKKGTIVKVSFIENLYLKDGSFMTDKNGIIKDYILRFYIMDNNDIVNYDIEHFISRNRNYCIANNFKYTKDDICIKEVSKLLNIILKESE